jgi:Cytochrome P460
MRTDEFQFGVRKNTSDSPVFITQGTTTRIIMPTYEGRPDKPKKQKPKPTETDGFTFGIVYANDPAKLEIDKANPKFPLGATIVREKRLKIDDEIPQVVIAMVKREKGFNKKTGDWEYFTFNGADMKLQKRESVSSCSKCHANAAKTDYVFRDFLK